MELDAGAEKIGAKIRNHTMAKTPLMLVIGEQEAAARSRQRSAVPGGRRRPQGQPLAGAFIER